MSILTAENPPGYRREDGIWVFPRTEFCEFRFVYKPGQHVVFGGPSTRGKTRMAFNCLQFVATPDLPAYVAVSKPDDLETARMGEKLGFRRVEEWPPIPKINEMFNGKPPGYLVWPKMGDIHKDVAKTTKITRDLMQHTYANGARKKHAILVMDDTMIKAKVLGLDGDMVTILAMAGAMGIGLWIFIQKNTDSGRVTVWGYEQATHYFLTKGGEKRVLDRYAEMAGELGPLVRRTIPTLEPFQFLYIQKYEGWVCIVDAA